jgi:hypothetical protein
MPSRLAFGLILISLATSGCARPAEMTGSGPGLSGPQDLGLVQKLPDLPVVLTYSAGSNNPGQMKQERNWSDGCGTSAASTRCNVRPPSRM